MWVTKLDLESLYHRIFYISSSKYQVKLSCDPFLLNPDFSTIQKSSPFTIQLFFLALEFLDNRINKSYLGFMGVQILLDLSQYTSDNNFWLNRNRILLQAARKFLDKRKQLKCSFNLKHTKYPKVNDRSSL